MTILNCFHPHFRAPEPKESLKTKFTPQNLITIETYLQKGLPQIHILDFPNKKSSDLTLKLKVAFETQGFKFPKYQVIIQLKSPLPIKVWPENAELAIAYSILSKTKQIPELKTKFLFFSGNLSLGGHCCQASSCWNEKGSLLCFLTQLKDFKTFHRLSETNLQMPLSDKINSKNFYSSMKKSLEVKSDLNLQNNTSKPTQGVDPLKQNFSFTALADEDIILFQLHQLKKYNILFFNQKHYKNFKKQSLKFFETSIFEVHSSHTWFDIKNILLQANGSILYIDDISQFSKEIIQKIKNIQKQQSIFYKAQYIPCKFQILAFTKVCPCNKQLPFYGNCSLSLTKCQSTFSHLLASDVFSLFDLYGSPRPTPKQTHQVLSLVEQQKSTQQPILENKAARILEILPHSLAERTHLLNICKDIARLENCDLANLKHLEKAESLSFKVVSGLSQKFL